MNKFFGGAAVATVGLIIFGVWASAVSFRFPWQPDLDFTDVEVTLSLPEEAMITAVEPITLDCRARVHASIPIEAKREHELFGKVYRTDTLEMLAIGDVDTCIEGSSAKVKYNQDGTTEVTIDGGDIVFVRPRVDAVKTADSVEVNKGLIGKWTDVFPWVDDDLGLTPISYAWAQNIIGGSDCMQAAYTVTQQILIDAYTEQFIANGADADKLSVQIDGLPDFSDPAPLDLDGIDMKVDETGTTCLVSEDLASGQSTPISS